MRFNGDVLGSVAGMLEVTGDGDTVDVTPVVTSGTKIATIVVNEGSPEEESVDLYAPEGFSGDYNDLTNKPDLFSGSYGDLTDKPSLNGVLISGNMYTDNNSTDEIMIGTFIDGKPKYQKTFYIETPTINQEVNMDISNLNIDYYVEGSGMFHRHVNWLSPELLLDTPLNLWESTDNHSFIRYDRTNHNLQYGIFMGRNESASDLCFTIQYTKV